MGDAIGCIFHLGLGLVLLLFLLGGFAEELGRDFNL